ncbi:MAG: Rax2 family protein [Planctomycetes bacterium]|jgi:hypothetical protein|nr:Rax2 family protein [Planctomycetota bacterium]
MKKLTRSLFPPRWSAFAGLFSLSVPLAAQCTLQVAPGDGVPGTSGPVFASQLWDPDGSGPLPQRLLVTGEFAVAGNVNANGVATYDLITGAWQGLDDGSWASHRVTTVVDAGNGQLIAAGFRPAVASTEVRRWNGSNWLPLGGVGAFSGPGAARVDALALMPNGDLVAAGRFTAVQGLACNNIARWNGTSWQPLGSGILGIAGYTSVEALAVRANGDLVAGGSFVTAGGATVSNCARWDGTAWSDFSAGISLPVATLKLLANGDLVAGLGSTQPIGGLQGSGVQRWNGAAWQPLGNAPDYRVEAIAQRPNGNLVAGGYGTTREWNGSSWQPLLDGLQRDVETITALPNGHLILGGGFQPFSSLPTQLPTYLGRWDGANWQRLGVGFDRRVTTVLSLRSGDILAGGTFQHVGQQTNVGLVRFDGSSWQSFAGYNGGTVADAAELENGDIFVRSENGLLRFDGAGWQSIGDPGLFSIEVVRDGSLIGGVSGGLVAWDGSDWKPLAAPFSGTTTDVEMMPNGDLVAAGNFGIPGSTTFFTLVHWNGSVWTGLAANELCEHLAPVAGGVLVAGSFLQIGGQAARNIARWDGVGFTALGNGVSGLVGDVEVLPDGSVLAAHNVIGNFGVGALSRWNGSAWTAIAFAESAIRGLSFGRRGLAIGGGFQSFAAAPSPFFALMESTCPASDGIYGNGCAGSGGVDRLRVSSPAWLGAELVTTASGLHANALVAGVYGLAPLSIPLPLLVPIALPGCQLLVAPDLLQLGIPSAGAARLPLAIPAAPALVGATIYHQAVCFELTFQGAFTSVTSSNGLQVTIGRF